MVDLLLASGGDDLSDDESDVVAPVGGGVASGVANVDDIDALLPGEKLEEFEAIDSEEGESDEEPDADDEQVAMSDVRHGLAYESDSEEELENRAAVLDEVFLDSLGGRVAASNLSADKDVLRDMDWTREVNGAVRTTYEQRGEAAAFAGLTKDVSKPRSGLRRAGESPVDLFFFFVPKALWVEIADQSNIYRRQQIEPRAKQIKEFQKKRQLRDSTAIVERKSVIRDRLRNEKPIEPHELTTVIGLLVARVLCPHKRKIESHWSLTDNGAIPAGTFSKFMSRQRFRCVLQNLHFADNTAARPVFDKCWKIRRVIKVLQRTFLAGWDLGEALSFDEGVLPSTSRHNTTRTFMPDKPHRWGSKLFITCDARTAYCYRYVLVIADIESYASTDLRVVFKI